MLRGSRWYLTVVLCLWCQLCGLRMGALANPDNPKPAEGDLVLPMPHNVTMVFRPVLIGKGENPFSLNQFDMGDPTGDFKEHLTRVGVGGAFVDQQGGQQSWLYYLGKYEVSEAQ